MQEHSPIELYIDVGDEQQNTLLEQQLTPTILDAVVLRTLQAVHLSQPVMLTILITNDDGIRDMNKQYREQDKPTDVLSFPLIERPLVDAPEEQLWPPQPVETPADTSHDNHDFVNPPGQLTNLGDIVMSWPTIVQQAQANKHNPLLELLYLLSHGVLHLVGYDDQSEAGYQAMVTIQKEVLRSLGQRQGQ